MRCETNNSISHTTFHTAAAEDGKQLVYHKLQQNVYILYDQRLSFPSTRRSIIGQRFYFWKCYDCWRKPADNNSLRTGEEASQEKFVLSYEHGPRWCDVRSGVSAFVCLSVVGTLLSPMGCKQVYISFLSFSFYWCHFFTVLADFGSFYILWKI